MIVALQAIPLLANGTWNYWDGDIIDYAVAKHDLSGLQKWFYDSNLPIQYWLIKGEVALAAALHLHFRFLEYAMVVICIGLCTWGVMRLATILTRDATATAVAGMFLAASPIWSLGLSSVLIQYLTFLTCALVGAMVVVSSRTVVGQVLGTVVLFVGFQLNSTATMTLGIALTVFVLRPDLRPRAVALGVLGLLGCGVILLGQKLFPPAGEYVGYNVVVARMSAGAVGSYASEQRALPVLLGALWSYLGPLALVAVGFVVLSRLLRPRLWHDRPLAVCLVCLVAALIAALPYIVIGRHSGFFDRRDWTLRNSVVVFPFLAVAASTFPLLLSAGRRRAALAALVLLPMLGLSAVRYTVLLRRRAEERSLVAQLAAIRVADSVHVLPGIRTPSHQFYRFYERSWLAYRAWGTSRVYPCINQPLDECVRDTQGHVFTSRDRALRLGNITDEF